jgi:pimeloyl-ACP methyl ester carboxylesterase
MPNADIRGINFYYELHGSGYPLILIRGLGSTADHWYCQLPAFSEHYCVVVFDNRGIGRSDRPEGPFTISDMAEDTVLLMDALGIARAHILGISMGGMIAQEIALKFARRVHGLILACTYCGGAHAVQPSPDIIQDLAESLFGRTQEAIQKGVRALFTGHTIRSNPDVVRRYGDVSARFLPVEEFLTHQIKAIQKHDTWADLIGIAHPTLVITGSNDVLVPPENSKLLAERIPNARLRMIENGGHQFLIEEPDAFNKAVLDFLGALPESS